LKEQREAQKQEKKDRKRKRGDEDGTTSLTSLPSLLYFFPISSGFCVFCRWRREAFQEKAKNRQRRKER
jgi:hypothetical protein